MKIIDKKIIVPNGWEKKRIRDLLDYERPDKYFVEHEHYTNTGKIPVLTANKSFILGYTEEDRGVYMDTPVIIFDDFTTDSKYVTFPFKIKSSAIKILKQKNDDVDLRFVYEKMKSINFPTGSHKRFYISQYQNMEVAIPPLPEQKKIAEILMTVDEEIKKTDEIISAVVKLRDGLMFDFFIKEPKRNKTNKKTFKEVLESVIDHRGLTPKKLGGDWSLFGIPTISAMNIKNGRIVKPQEIRFVDDVLYKKWMPEEIRDGDVILTSEAPLGEAYVVKPNERYCLSQRLFGLRPDRNKITSGYLYYFLTSPIGEKRLFDRATGSTAKGIRQTELLKVEVAIPKLTRQNEITTILVSIDEKIQINLLYKNKLEKLKKGLMQDLLTGAVRVE